MERTRVAAILKMENGYAFMHRKDVIKRKDYQEYYTLGNLFFLLHLFYA